MQRGEREDSYDPNNFSVSRRIDLLLLLICSFMSLKKKLSLIFPVHCCVTHFLSLPVLSLYPFTTLSSASPSHSTTISVSFFLYV